jgi:probable HAF family extracellular repeat protein
MRGHVRVAPVTAVVFLVAATAAGALAARAGGGAVHTTRDTTPRPSTSTSLGHVAVSAAHNPDALRTCLQKFGESDMGEKVPGYVDIDIMTNGGVPLRDLVVAFGSQARERLAVGLRVATTEWPGKVAIRGAEGDVVWAAVGPAQGGPTFSTPAREAQFDRQAKNIVARCLEASRTTRAVKGTALPVGASLPTRPAGTSETRWQITDLGTLGGKTSEAEAINNAGQIAGTAATADEYGDPHAVLWQARRVTDLGALAAYTSEAVSINGPGKVIGNRVTRDGNTRAFLWEDGRMRDLAPVYGTESRAVAINDKGEIIGDNGDSSGGAVLWRNGHSIDLLLVKAAAINNRGQIVGGQVLWENGKITDLNPKTTKFAALAINNSGQVAGERNASNGYFDWTVAFLWQGRMTVLPTLPGKNACIVAGINDHAQIAGTCGIPEPMQDPIIHEHIVVWKDGQITDLGTLGGECQAAAINEHGQVVGWSQAGGANSHAFVSENHVMTDLGVLPGGTESNAVALNDHGQIVGWSTTKNGQKHAVLWTLKTGS